MIGQQREEVIMDHREIDYNMYWIEFHAVLCTFLILLDDSQSVNQSHHADPYLQHRCP